MTSEQAGMPPNRSMMGSAVIPELAYADVREAAAWLCRAFGFTERLRIGTHRVQLTHEGGALVVIELPEGMDVGAARAAAATHAVMVRVHDADAHCASAEQAGARIVRRPESHPFGERQYSAEDPGGHRWTFSETIADVDPASWGGEFLST